MSRGAPGIVQFRYRIHKHIRDGGPGGERDEAAIVVNHGSKGVHVTTEQEYGREKERGSTGF
jgi:hypothetical protein